MTSRYAVTGKPVMHSESPALHRAGFRYARRDATYLRLMADSAQESLYLFKELGLSGMNVTSPFKEHIAALLDETDSLASRVGAVNTVLSINGKTHGYNTDPKGFALALNKAGICSGYNGLIFVLGTGGAARSALSVLKAIQIQNVAVISRDVNRAKTLANVHKYDAHSYKQITDKADIIVSCLPRNIEIPAHLIGRDSLIIDANYKAKKPAGVKKYVSGASWLAGQAIATFSLFTGVDIPVEVMMSAFDKSLQTRDNIALIGSTGAGKTTVGKHLANLRGWSFVDTDAEVERRTGDTVDKIFKRDGEAKFRQWEQLCIEENVSHHNKTIFAVGAGALSSSRSKKTLCVNARIIWLWSNPQTCAERLLNAGNRPMLGERDRKMAISKLLEHRIDDYAACADGVIDTARRTPMEIAQRIQDEIDLCR